MTRAPLPHIALIVALALSCTAYPDEATEQEPAEQVESAIDPALSGLAAWAVNSVATPWSLGSDASGNALYVGPVENGWLLLKRDPYGRELLRRSLPSRTMNAGFGRDGTIALAGIASTDLPTNFGCGIKPGNFVVKLRADGACLWHRTVTTAETWYPGNVAMAADGRVVVTGDTFAAIDFGEGSLAADEQVFVARYDQAGELEGARVFGKPRGTGDRTHQRISNLALDGAGNIYLGGFHHDALSFDDVQLADPGPDAAIAAFFVKLDRTGIPRSGRSFGTNSSTAAIDVTADGRVAIAGAFKGAMDFGNGKTLFNGSGSTDTFIAVFETNATIRWVKKLWGRALASVHGIGFDADGNVAVGGSVSRLGTDTTSPWHVGSYEFDVPANSAFVARFAPLTGSTRWARVYSANAVSVESLAVTPNNGRVLIGGFLNGTVDFGRGKTLSGEMSYLTRLYP